MDDLKTKKTESMKKRKATMRQKRAAKAEQTWTDLRAKLLDQLKHQKEWPVGVKTDYKLYSLVVHSSSIGNNKESVIGYIESITPGGAIRVRYLPMKRTTKLISHDSYWTTEVDVQAIEACKSHYALGDLIIFTWKALDDGTGYFKRGSNSCGYSMIDPYDCDRDSKPFECY